MHVPRTVATAILLLAALGLVASSAAAGGVSAEGCAIDDGAGTVTPVDDGGDVGATCGSGGGGDECDWCTPVDEPPAPGE